MTVTSCETLYLSPYSYLFIANFTTKPRFLSANNFIMNEGDINNTSYKQYEGQQRFEKKIVETRLGVNFKRLTS